MWKAVAVLKKYCVEMKMKGRVKMTISLPSSSAPVTILACEDYSRLKKHFQVTL